MIWLIWLIWLLDCLTWLTCLNWLTWDGHWCFECRIEIKKTVILFLIDLICFLSKINCTGVLLRICTAYASASKLYEDVLSKILWGMFNRKMFYADALLKVLRTTSYYVHRNFLKHINLLGNSIIDNYTIGKMFETFYA